MKFFILVIFVVLSVCRSDANEYKANQFILQDPTSANKLTLKTQGMSNSFTFQFPVDDGTNGQALTTNGSGLLSWTTVTTTPAGSDGQVQYNNGGVFGAEAEFFWDDVNNFLGLGITTPQQTLHIDTGTGNASLMQFTNGATTGQAATDGFVIGISSGGVAQIRQRESLNMQFFTANVQVFSMMSNGNVGNQNNSGTSLATSATAGFFHINTTAGAPSGTPSAFNGLRPINIDITNDKFYFYSNGWKSPASAVGSLGSGNANGFDITAGVATLHAATSTQPGAVSATTQSFGGDKTFLGSVESETSFILEEPDAGTNAVTLTASATTGTYTFTFPVDDGDTDECLKTDGSGVTSWGECGSGGGGADNYIINPNAVINTSDVTASGGSLTRNTSTPLYGVADFAIDLSASAQTVTWDSSAMDNYLKYGNCQGSLYYKGDASLYKAYVTINSVKVSQEIQLTNESTSTASRQVILVFPCGDLSNVAKVVVEATDNAAAAINVGKVFVGEAGLISVGTETGWTQYTPTFTQFGTVSTQSFWWKRIGDSLYIHGRFTTGTVGGSEARISLPSDFVTSSNITTLQIFGKYGRSTGTVNSHGGFVTVAPSVAYINFSNFDTFGSGSITPIGAAVGSSVAGNTEVLSVQAGPIPIQGWSSTVSAVPADQTDFGWRDCTTATGSPTQGLGTITVNSCKIKRHGEFAEINQDITLGTRAASEARIALPDGLVLSSSYPSVQPCLAGDVLVNVTTTVDYMVKCGASLNYITIGFNDSSPNGGSTDQLGDAIFSNGARIKINYKAKIHGWVENQKAPLLVGSVTSGYSGAMRMEFFKFYTTAYGTACTGTPCGITSSLTGATVTRSGTGKYQLTFPTGTWTSAPACFFNIDNGAGNHTLVNKISDAAPTTTAYTFSSGLVGTGFTDSYGEIFCVGFR